MDDCQDHSKAWTLEKQKRNLIHAKDSQDEVGDRVMVYMPNAVKG